MKFIALATAAFAATTAAVFVAPPDAGNVKVVNRCSYDVYLWNVVKQTGCEAAEMVTLKKGQSWTQQMGYFWDQTKSDDGGVSIKLSKSQTCGGQDITQLEYKLKWVNDTENPDFIYNGNYLDMSFVDCQTAGNCPGYNDGYYMKSGNQASDAVTAAGVTDCPIFGVSNAVEAAKVAYILPNDVQTKFCPIPQDLALYVCGGEAPSAGDETSSVAPSSTAPSSTSKIPTPTSKASSSSSDLAIAKAAAVTPAPEVDDQPPKAVKTVIEYVTVSVDAPVRRHAHGRRHHHIHA